MTGPASIPAAAANGPGSEPNTADARLRAACAQLEGVFMTELMKAMRETMPKGGMIDGGAGERIFESLFDEHIAELAASRQERGLGAALYRQLRAALHAGSPQPSSPQPSSPQAGVPEVEPS